MNPKLMYPVKFPRCFMIWKQIIQFWITVSYTRYEIVTVTRKIVGNDALKSKPFAITVSVVTGFSPFKKENNKKNRKKHALCRGWLHKRRIWRSWTWITWWPHVFFVSAWPRTIDCRTQRVSCRAMGQMFGGPIPRRATHCTSTQPYMVHAPRPWAEDQKCRRCQKYD